MRQHAARLRWPQPERPSQPARPAGRTIPILILSGLDEPETRQNAFHTGATDFLAKPFKAADLLQRVSTLLAKTTPPAP